MDQINQVQAQRVWQRVRGSEQASPEVTLSALITAEWEDATTYLQLSKKLCGRESAILYKMFQQEQAHCSCLKGIYTIATGNKPALPKVTPVHGPIEQILRNSYGREMRAVNAYDARSQDPEYGHVFIKLRDQEQEHCRLILELIGSLSKK